MADKHKSKKSEMKNAPQPEQKPPASQSGEREFDDFFTDLCVELQIPAIPVIRHFDVNASTLNVSFAQTSDDVQRPQFELDAHFDYVEKALRKLEFRSSFALDEILQAFDSIAARFGTLDTLVLSDCGLDAVQITALGLALTVCPHVTCVDLDRNPNGSQNFDELLRATPCLKQLSLKHCRIDGCGVARIADALNASSLVALNLSSNFLTDVGVEALATSLRTNRTLASLDVANNMITDVGAAKLLDTLRTFALDDDETVLRRRRKYATIGRRRVSLHSRLVCIDHERRPKQGGSFASFSSRRRASSKDSGSIKSKSSHRGSGHHKKPDRISIVDQCASLFDEQQDTHPFVKDCFAHDGAVYCAGNFRLVHLNLSYNKLTSASVRLLVDVVRYQAETVWKPYCGLYFVDVEGNDFQRDETAELYAFVHKSSACNQQEVDASRTSAVNVAKKNPAQRK